MSGFGHSGPHADFRSYGPVVQAASGLSYVAGLPGREPSGWGLSHMDNMAAYYNSAALLMAIWSRNRTGQGTEIDVAAVEVGVGLLGPVLLDVRWRLGGPPGLDTYREGHLPEAVFIDLDRDLAAPPGPGGRHPLPDPAAFQEAMRAAGVSQDRPVVVYDDRDATAAARGWWLLRYYGHENVKLVNGGRVKWEVEGRPYTTDVPQVTATEYSFPSESREDLRAYRDQVLAAIGKSGLVHDAAERAGLKGVIAP